MEKNSENLPLFARALGERWSELHATVRRHYDLGPGQELLLTGAMSEVYHSPWVKPFIWIGRLFGALVPYCGTDVPTEVFNFCTPGSTHLNFRRRFVFPGIKPYPFNSRMEHLRDNEIVEFVRFGLGIRMKLSVIDDALCYDTAGYLWRMGLFDLHLPDWLFFGMGRIIERGVDDDHVEMDFVMTHPLFGKTFRYAGRFRLNPP